MALPREILSSVQIESVNAARVSGDYRLSRDNWRIGISTHLATALGLAAFKDTFWSSTVNTEHPFYYDCMIGEDEQDPNVPWTISYRYDGPRSKTRKLSFLFVLSPITYVLTSLQFLVKTAFLGMTWTFITPLQTTILNGMPVELLGDFHIWVAKANLGASPMLAFKSTLHCGNGKPARFRFVIKIADAAIPTWMTPASLCAISFRSPIPNVKL